MRIDKNHPDFDRTLCFLDGRLVKAAVAADDTEGWVDIVVVSTIRPHKIEIINGKKVMLDESPTPITESDEYTTPWEELEIKRKYGVVELKKLP